MPTSYGQQYRVLPGLGSAPQVSHESRSFERSGADATRPNPVARSLPETHTSLRDAYDQNHLLSGLSIHTSPPTSLPAAYDSTDRYGRQTSDSQYMSPQMRPQERNGLGFDGRRNQVSSSSTVGIIEGTSFNPPEFDTNVALECKYPVFC